MSNPWFIYNGKPRINRLHPQWSRYITGDPELYARLNQIEIDNVEWFDGVRGVVTGGGWTVEKHVELLNSSLNFLNRDIK